MYIEDAYVNSLDLSYSTGGVGTENFSLESDNKKWVLNYGRCVVTEEVTNLSGFGTHVVAAQTRIVIPLHYPYDLRYALTTATAATNLAIARRGNNNKMFLRVIAKDVAAVFTNERYTEVALNDPNYADYDTIAMPEKSCRACGVGGVALATNATTASYVEITNDLLTGGATDTIKIRFMSQYPTNFTTGTDYAYDDVCAATGLTALEELNLPTTQSDGAYTTSLDAARKFTFYRKVPDPEEAKPDIAGGLMQGQVEVWLFDAARVVKVLETGVVVAANQITLANTPVRAYGVTAVKHAIAVRDSNNDLIPVDSVSGVTITLYPGAVSPVTVEYYKIKPGQDYSAVNPADLSFTLRLSSATVSADLGREAISELGHKRPYTRPLTFPIPVTVSVETLDSDMELFGRLAGYDYTSNTLYDATATLVNEVSIDDLLKDKAIVIKIFRETDVERSYVNEGDADDWKLYPMKTIVIKKLNPTDEERSAAVGDNATQTFGFRTDNIVFICPLPSGVTASDGSSDGRIDYEGVVYTSGINPSGIQYFGGTVSGAI
jgi:hypothetical protein